MENFEEQVIRLEENVKHLEKSVQKIETFAIDVAIIKKQSQMQTVKELVHYFVTTVAVALGIKGAI